MFEHSIKTGAGSAFAGKALAMEMFPLHGVIPEIPTREKTSTMPQREQQRATASETVFSLPI
ncbi:hypothetical protein [Nitrospira sp.]|uniref:hypothetical protein n=1 Tax=Nitrospira sp. TaxID=70125 RepID=UPI003FCCCE19